MARTGVFVCWCGSNIAKTVDVERVAGEAGNLPGVVHAAHYRYMCSEPGQALVRQAIADHRLDRIVVAACSPRLHEPTFRKCIAQSGLNPFMAEMANIREHCSWVHADRETATAKAIDLTRMAAARIRRNEPLSQTEIPIAKKALVVGGGIAGIQAALDIAEAGYQVTLVERTPSIGGRMAQFDKTFPTLDCAACILTPKMVECASNPNIRILSYAEVEAVSGFVGNFEVKIRRRARGVDMEKCTGCGVCYEKCPVTVSSEFEAGMGTRKAIYVPFPQAVPNVPVIDREHCTYYLKGRCRICEKFCQPGAVNFEEQDEILAETFGAIVMATGFDLWDPSALGEYGGGQIPDVISGLQFERLVNASGPTGGKVLRPSDHTEPKTVVFVACVGSRDPAHGHAYCSKVCCMYTAKHALLLKEKVPDAKAYIFYMDIRANGKGYEEFVQRVVERYDATYVRGRVSRIYPLDGHLVVMGADTLLGRPVEVHADMVVLATAMEPRADAKEMARKLGLSTDQDNWLSEAHPKLRPVEVLTAGIFLAGACQYPKDIPDTVAQASGAAAKVVDLFSKPHLLSEPMIACVDEQSCVACLLCKEVCPFAAIEAAEAVDPATRKPRATARVNSGLCHGCGTCVAACRSASIRLFGFSDDQILLQLDSLALAHEETK
ncbi:MAG: CoB--CoM heterodisulfide reductase iron-sulfur subunit A family protein [Zetaproteobacteria bacterium]|nr:MAG: CoB--CoM heterodisulfide reductase iron-sulfur subunit A family protein [Zetaproteobacteria bacterium]